jgi:hypothetical protein
MTFGENAESLFDFGEKIFQRLQLKSKWRVSSCKNTSFGLQLETKT